MKLDKARDIISKAVDDATMESVTNKDGLWLVGLDRPDASVRDYSGEASLYKVSGDDITLVYGPVPWASHPGQVKTNADGTPDVDGDGQRDVAWTIPGLAYRMKSKRSSSGRFNPVTKTQHVYRDTQKAGRFIDLDYTIYEATAIQYHAGGSSKPTSVGCWTSPPREFEKMAAAIEKHANGTFWIIFDVE